MLMNQTDQNQCSYTVTGENILIDLKHKLEVKPCPYLLQQ